MYIPLLTPKTLITWNLNFDKFRKSYVEGPTYTVVLRVQHSLGQCSKQFRVNFDTCILT